MIDLHSHILPDLDDGPRTMEESLEMLRMAAAAGTTDIAATAHANHQFSFTPAVVERKLNELRTAGGPVPRLHYGCELHLTIENIAAVSHSPREYSIAHGGYLLVELPDLQIPPHIEEIFQRLLAAGVCPIVAHPERNLGLRSRYRQLQEWVRMGCGLQITAQSITGGFGSTARIGASELLRRGLVHLVASDAHDKQHRPPTLADARNHVERRYGEAAGDLLFRKNPAAVLAGNPIVPLPKRRWW